MFTTLSEELHSVRRWRFKGGCGSGVESASCYRKVAGSVSLVCMWKCPWTRYWTPHCSWCAGRHLAWQPPPEVYERMYELLSLWTKVSKECPKKCKMFMAGKDTRTTARWTVNRIRLSSLCWEVKQNVDAREEIKRDGHWVRGCKRVNLQPVFGDSFAPSVRQTQSCCWICNN